MSERVTMPALGESVTEGTVTRWLKNVGDTIEVDEPLLEVSTDKVDTEIPSPVAGTIEQILVGEDDTVPVGADLAVIGDGSSSEGDAGGSGSAENADAGQEAAQGDVVQPSADQPVEAEAAAPQATAPEAPAAQAQPTAETPAATSGSSGGAGEVSGGTTVTMPALGESVTEGTVTRWLKSEGDSVEVDEPLLEVSTDKVDTEIPSPVAGTVTKILVAEDETVPVGADLAIVGGEASGSAATEAPPEAAPASAAAPEQTAQAPAPAHSDPAPAEPASAPEPARAPEPAQSAQAAPQAPAPPAPAAPTSASSSPGPAPSAGPPASAGSGSSNGATDASAYVTPLVRKLAADNGVDLGSLAGTGVGGRIRKQDVLDAAKAAAESAAAPKEPAPQAEQASGPTPAVTAAPTPTPSPEVSAKRGTTEKMTRLRKVIAQRMVESLQVSAQLTSVVEVDVTRVARLRDRAKKDFLAREGVGLSFLPFFALAAVEALKSYPTVNASINGDQIVYHGAEHLGIAVDTDRGLLVPVIRDAGDLNIAGLSRKIADLAERTRTNKVSPDELGGGTFTLTNTGSRGALFDTPIINQPQVAILGTGAVVKRPVVVKDADGLESIAIRSMVYLALSYDHRLVDGADAARFLVAMKNRLEEGAFEASLGL